MPFTIFQGGMPRASYGDRHCISVVHNGQQTAFDFTSRVIDFTVLTEADPAAGRRALEVGVLGRYKNEGCHVDVFKPSTLPGPLALSSFFIPMTPVNPPLPPLPILPGADPVQKAVSPGHTSCLFQALFFGPTWAHLCCWIYTSLAWRGGLGLKMWLKSGWGSRWPYGASPGSAS